MSDMAHPVRRDRIRLIAESILFVLGIVVVVAAMSLDYQP